MNKTHENKRGATKMWKAGNQVAISKLLEAQGEIDRIGETI